MFKLHLITSLLLKKTNISPWEDLSLQPCGLNYFEKTRKKLTFFKCKCYYPFIMQIRKLLCLVVVVVAVVVSQSFFLTRKSKQKWPSYFMTDKHIDLRKALP